MAATTDPQLVIDASGSVLLIDWPSRDVPESLARAGMKVTAHSGPGPDEYDAFELDGGDVVKRHVGEAPGHVDLVYSFRPLDELAGIVAFARDLGAMALWTQSGAAPDGSRDVRGCWMSPEDSARARAAVEAGGLAYVESPYIGDAAGQRWRRAAEG